MTLGDLLKQYFNKEISAIKLIRTLTGMFDPDHAIDILAITNQICRHEEGDIDTETFKSIYKIE